MPPENEWYTNGCALCMLKDCGDCMGSLKILISAYSTKERINVRSLFKNCIGHWTIIYYTRYTKTKEFQWKRVISQEIIITSFKGFREIPAYIMRDLINFFQWGTINSYNYFVSLDLNFIFGGFYKKERHAETGTQNKKKQ